MNIVVCIKQTFDTEARIILDKEGHIDEGLVKFILNPYDEYAIEEAIRLTEKHNGNVTLVSASLRNPSQALRQGLAMGANRAVWINCTGLNGIDPYVCTKVLAQWLRRQSYDLVLCGKEAIDDGASEVPSRLAEALGLPQVTAVSSLIVEGEKWIAKREIEGGFEVIELSLPCLLSAQKGLNEPRYPSMRRILQAKKIKIEEVSLEQLGLNSDLVKPLTQVEKYIIPPPRQAGRILEGSPKETVNELLTILRDEKKVI